MASPNITKSIKTEAKLEAKSPLNSTSGKACRLERLEVFKKLSLAPTKSHSYTKSEALKEVKTHIASSSHSTIKGIKRSVDRKRVLKTTKKRRKRRKRKRSSNLQRQSASDSINREIPLSRELSKIVNATSLCRPKVIQRIWEYAKTHNLVDPNQSRSIICDDALRAVFPHNRSVHMFQMQTLLLPHFLYNSPGTFQDVVDYNDTSGEVPSHNDATQDSINPLSANSVSRSNETSFQLDRPKPKRLKVPDESDAPSIWDMPSHPTSGFSSVFKYEDMGLKQNAVTLFHGEQTLQCDSGSLSRHSEATVPLTSEQRGKISAGKHESTTHGAIRKSDLNTVSFRTESTMDATSLDSNRDGGGRCFRTARQYDLSDSNNENPSVLAASGDTPLSKESEGRPEHLKYLEKFVDGVDFFSDILNVSHRYAKREATDIKKELISDSWISNQSDFFLQATSPLELVFGDIERCSLTLSFVASVSIVVVNAFRNEQLHFRFVYCEEEEEEVKLEKSDSQKDLIDRHNCHEFKNSSVAEQSVSSREIGRDTQENISLRNYKYPNVCLEKSNWHGLFHLCGSCKIEGLIADKRYRFTLQALKGDMERFTSAFDVGTIELMKRNNIAEWTVEMVCVYIHSLHIPSFARVCSDFAINGSTLVGLTKEDFFALGLNAPFLVKRIVESVKRLLSDDV